MKRHQSRWLVWLAMAFSGATVFQTAYPITSTNGIYGPGCVRFATNGILTSIDFCQVFDCQNGFLGGAVQPCGDGGTGGNPLFVDCGTTETEETQ